MKIASWTRRGHVWRGALPTKLGKRIFNKRQASCQGKDTSAARNRWRGALLGWNSSKLHFSSNLDQFCLFSATSHFSGA